MIPPLNAYVEVLMPSPSECDLLHGKRVIADELSSLEWAVIQDKCPYRKGKFVHKRIHKNTT